VETETKGRKGTGREGEGGRERERGAILHCSISVWTNDCSAEVYCEGVRRQVNHHTRHGHLQHICGVRGGTAKEARPEYDAQVRGVHLRVRHVRRVGYLGKRGVRL
jgi:hypothetical protein